MRRLPYCELACKDFGTPVGGSYARFVFANLQKVTQGT
jgi:hypothetical protein